MTDQNIELGLNAKECLKSTTDLTQTTYHDICTGAVHVIEHGTADLFIVAFFGVIIALFAVLFIGVTKMVFDN